MKRVSMPQPEEYGREQGQNDMENRLPFAAREDARRRRRGADETSAQSVKVATEIGQESACRRNMQGNIIQQINLPLNGQGNIGQGPGGRKKKQEETRLSLAGRRADRRQNIP